MATITLIAAMITCFQLNVRCGCVRERSHVLRVFVCSFVLARVCMRDVFTTVGIMHLRT
jgi:hypothetical protein